MAGRHHAISTSATAVLVLLLTACGGSSRAEPTHTTDQPSAQSTVTTTSSADPTPPAPNPASPALASFSNAQVAHALDTAQQAAIAGIADTTLVQPVAHAIADYAATERFLTPTAKAQFQQFFQQAEGKNGDPTAAQNVFAYAFFQAPGSEFTPDVPPTITRTTVTADPLVTTDTSPAGVTRMVVTGAVSVGYIGTDPPKGGHGVMLISRTYTYSLVPTTPTSNTVAIDGWHSDTHYADKLEPDPTASTTK